MVVLAAKYNQPVKFTFDMREESEHNSAFLYKMYRERPEVKVDMFRNVTFARSREEPRVQVADLWARETMKALAPQHYSAAVKRGLRWKFMETF